MAGKLTINAAVITGGASGIGFALAERIGKTGARVVLGDLPGERLDRAVAVLASKGLEVIGHGCDVSVLDEVEQLAEVAFALGPVDLLLNNAGESGPTGRQWEVDVNRARRHFDVNFWGVWHGCTAFIPRLARQPSPSAVYNTASENALFCAGPRMGAYIAAKHAVLGMTESLREDLPAHVHAGTIMPGWVQTSIGSEGIMRHAMPPGRFADIVLPQLLACRRFVVSHSYNAVRMQERVAAIDEAFLEFAPRYSGDDEFDVRAFIERRANSS